jgi:hypothetical protein
MAAEILYMLYLPRMQIDVFSIENNFVLQGELLSVNF